tara:strand:- start:376 stop:1125 length:750 start_codon:yes stop_codon:yes gene_type:complete
MNKKLKNKIRSNELTIGSWLTIANNNTCEIMCNGNFDWLVVDLEHTTISINEAGELIRIIDLSKKSPLVRLTSINRDQIKRILDAGAHGIIAPNVLTKNDVDYIVDSVFYPPIGKRGVGLGRAHKYGSDFKNYFKRHKSEIIIIVQIENIKALENLDEIFKNKKIDAYIIGPYDLSASMGIPGDFNSIEFKNAINYIKKIGKKYNLCSGMHVVEPDKKELSKNLKNGFKFISYSVDMRILDSSVKNLFK